MTDRLAVIEARWGEGSRYAELARSLGAKDPAEDVAWLCGEVRRLRKIVDAAHTWSVAGSPICGCGDLPETEQLIDLLLDDEGTTRERSGLL